MKICKFDGARRIGPPRTWDENLDGECLDIYVADHIEVLTGLPIMFTLYQLTDEELEALKNGGVLRLGIVGTQHPVFQMSVLSPELVEMIKPEPAGDLGPIITGDT